MLLNYQFHAGNKLKDMLHVWNLLYVIGMITGFKNTKISPPQKKPNKSKPERGIRLIRLMEC